MHKAFLSIALLAPAIAAAQTRGFDQIDKRQTIRVVLPTGYCDTKVVERRGDVLRLKLKETTSTCGQKGSIVLVHRSAVQDVVPKRTSALQRARRGLIAGLAGLGLTVFAAAAAYLIHPYALLAMLVGTPALITSLQSSPVAYDVFVTQLGSPAVATPPSPELSQP